MDDVDELLGRNADRQVTTGDRIRDWRLRRSFTLEELASRAGISVSFLSRVETNKRDLSLDTLASIASSLGINRADLLPGLKSVPVIGIIGPGGEAKFSEEKTFPAINARHSFGSFPFAMQVIDNEVGQMLNGYYIYFDGLDKDMDAVLIRARMDTNSDWVTALVLWHGKKPLLRVINRSDKASDLFDYTAWNTRPLYAAPGVRCIPVQAIVPPDRVQWEGTWDNDGAILSVWQNFT